MRHLPLWLRPLAAFPIRRIPIHIRRGPNRGQRWSLAAAGGRQYLSGHYEQARMELIERLVVPGDHFWDGGAHQGYVTLLAARKVGPAGRVVAFEPFSHSRWYLETHVRWSGFRNVTIVPAALSTADGTARFGTRKGGTGGSVAFRLGAGHENVVVRSLDSLMAEGLKQPTYLKLDVEGAESDVLRGGSSTMRHVELAVISVHSLATCHECIGLLSEAGFALYCPPRLSRYLSGEEHWRGDPDLVAVRTANRRRQVEQIEGFTRVTH